MTTIPIFSATRMNYETPREGITIGGYIARRLHKTVLLKPVPEFIKTDSVRALAQIGLYATAASASFGPALYQPDSDRVGAVLATIDPETDAHVEVTNEGNLRFAYKVTLAGVGTLKGKETITGTTVGLRGLGMPAPTVFTFEAERGDYRADIVGIITSELAPRIGTWRIRGYGTFDLSDAHGNRGKLTLDRAGKVVTTLTDADGKEFKDIQQLY